VASLLQLVLFAFQTAFLPIVFQRADAPETKDQLARVFTYFCLFCFSAIAVLALFRQEVFHFLIGADFAAATAYVPALLGAAFFAGVYVFFPGLMLSGKTTKIAQINIAGLSANLLLNMVLIPLYGLHGAACATLAAAAMTAGIYYKVAAASYPAPYRFGALGLAGGVTVLAVYLAEALNPFGLSYIGMGYKALVCATITMGLLLALVPADLRRVAAFLRRRLT
jgi:O-antigen/teichoic acid export membrane protein